MLVIFVCAVVGCTIRTTGVLPVIRKDLFEVSEAVKNEFCLLKPEELCDLAEITCPSHGEEVIYHYHLHQKKTLP